MQQLLPGIAAVVAAVLLLLWPLNEPGVTGTPLAPHYRPFGWNSYVSLPEHPKLDELRRAGIPLPQDAVHRRHVESGAAAAIAVAGLASWWGTRRRQRLTT